MSETLSSVEQFVSLTKYSDITNRDKNGYTHSDGKFSSTGVFTALFGYDNRPQTLRKIAETKYGSGDAFTRVALVPLWSTGIRQSDVPVQFKSDYAICIEHIGDNADQRMTEGKFTHIAVMAPLDASHFYEAILEDPTLVYDYIHALNGGPIRRYDGSPLDIKAGEKVEVWPNPDKPDLKRESKPFPPGYNPNPLFK